MNIQQSSYYNSNIQLLKTKHPVLWNYINSIPDKLVGTIIKSCDDKLNLKYIDEEGTEIYLHDENDPEAEISTFLEIVPEDSHGFVAIFGLGLGYSLKAILKKRPNLKHIVVFEPTPGIFLQALNVMDLSDALSDPRVIIALGKDPDLDMILNTTIRALQLEDVHLLRHLPSYSVAGKTLEKIHKKVFDFANTVNLDSSTKAARGYYYLKNRLEQLKSTHHNFLLEDLSGALANVPAILVAGGPSLDKNIHALANARDKAVIIAADSVLPVLLARGITPHFVTAIDVDDLTHEKIVDSASQSKEISLVCMSWVVPYVPKRFPAKNVFWTFCANPIELWMSKMLSGSLMTGGAGTQAHLSLITAQVLGCSPIIFVGQDLAYTDGKDHAQSVTLGDHEDMERFMKSGNALYVDGINGEKYPTRHNFYKYKQTFEQMMGANPNHYINATAEGANLEGTEVLPLHKAIHFYCGKTVNISERITPEGQSASEKSDKIISGIRDTLKEIEENHKHIASASRHSKQVLGALDNLKNKPTSFTDLPSKLQKTIRKIDSSHSDLDASNIWSYMQDVSTQALKASERMKTDIGKMDAQPEKYLEWLKTNLERLEYINDARKTLLAELQPRLEHIYDFLTQEKQLLSQIDEAPDKHTSMLELARLYFEAGEYVLAQPIFEELYNYQPSKAESAFYLGIISAHQGDLAKSRNYLAQADTPENKEKIADFHYEFGSHYHQYAIDIRSSDRNSSVRLIAKGLYFCPEHPDLLKLFKDIATEDIELTEATSIQEQAHRIENWHRVLEKHGAAAELLSPEQASQLYLLHGQLQSARSKHALALSDYRKALTFWPTNATAHICIKETLFAIGEFPAGIDHLRQAVLLNHDYATHWEQIGDNLLQSNQPQEAVTAFENCFTALPDKIDILKKIGDCYYQLGEEEAASEAYRQHRQRAETVSAVQ